MYETPRARLVVCGLAVLATAAEFLLRWRLRSVLGDRALYSPFFPSVLIAAYLGGFWPGLVVTFLCAATANYFFVEPLFALGLKGPDDTFALTLFVVTGVFISAL